VSRAVIHVIDDDQAMRQSLVFLLESAGLTVRAHRSALDFLGHVDGADPGVIVTDVRMPGMSGLELVRWLNSRGLAWRAIVMTGHGDISLAVEATRAGAAEFLEKPFEDKALLWAIRAILGKLDAAGSEDS
jgi:two-component system response regulator FixJ